MIAIQVQIGGSLDRFAAGLDAAVNRHLHAGIHDALLEFDARLKTERMRGQGVETRTGALRRSFGIAFADQLTGIYTTTSKYYRIQEYGGTIVPKNARMLAIPLKAALTPAGASRYPSPLRQSLAMAFPEGTFVRKSKAGNLILFGVKTSKRKKASQIVPLFLLRDHVTIRPNLGLRALWAEFQSRDLDRIMVGYMERALNEAASGSGDDG